MSSVPSWSALQNPSAVLNRLTLCFLDADIEREFRLQRAEASRPILRRFIVFMAVLAGFVTTGIRHKLDVARAAGMPVPPQLDMSGAGLAFGATLAAVLFAATLSRRLVPYLHTITALCMAGLVMVDSWHSQQLPLAYALYGTLLNLVVVYVASQLRFAVATLLGIGSTLAYLCCTAARNTPGLHSDPELQLKMGVTVMLLGCANLILMFVTHQRELLARLAYYRARLLEQRGSELEAALASLEQAELQLVEQEKQATVGRLVAGILHEMNTPLGALSSATQTLGRGLVRVRSLAERSQPAAADLGSASEFDAHAGQCRTELLETLTAAERLTGVQAMSAERIREVVQGLEQFVALDHASLQVADVRAGLERAVSFIRPALPRDVTITLELPEHPIWVKCFPAKLNQVFLNVLKNAASAFDDGASGDRSISVIARASGAELEIEVRDTGRGIHPERLRRIFDLDFSRQGSRVKLSLGLPASRGVVEAVGGRIRLESEPGRGSRVVIELPLGDVPHAATTARAAPAPAAVGIAAEPGQPADVTRLRPAARPVASA